MSATVKLTAEVLEVLNAAAVEGNTLRLTGQLDRKTYTAVNKALELMGGKWSRSARAHVFEDAAQDVIADAVATGLVVDTKKHFQFFETPPDVAKRLVELAAPQRKHKILEPSAGQGAIIKAINAYFPVGPRGFEQPFPTVYACELWDKNRVHLVNMGSPILEHDFLKLRDCTFDRVIANPPFTRGQDIEHVSHMWRVTKPGGRIVSVMAAGWRFNMARKFQLFREWIELAEGEWHELPPGSFAPSGTMVQAGILVLNKPLSDG